MLSLDVDAVLLTDIYALLRAPPLLQQDVIITRNTDQSQSLCATTLRPEGVVARPRGPRPASREHRKPRAQQLRLRVLQPRRLS